MKTTLLPILASSRTSAKQSRRGRQDFGFDDTAAEQVRCRRTMSAQDQDAPEYFGDDFGQKIDLTVRSTSRGSPAPTFILCCRCPPAALRSAFPTA